MSRVKGRSTPARQRNKRGTPPTPPRAARVEPRNDKTTHHEVRVMRLAELKPSPYNPRTISDGAIRGLQKSIGKFGLVEPVIWNQRSGFIVGGHQRVVAMQAEGIEEAQVVVVDLSEKEERALNVTLNNPHIQGEFNNDMLVSLLDQIQNEGEVDFEGLRLDKLLEKIMSSSLDDAHSTLAERFGVPPFSVLDARQGYWQDRKRAWIALGIKSELGRGGDLLTLAPAEQARSRWKLSPKGSPRPACDYGKRQRGDGQGKPINSVNG